MATIPIYDETILPCLVYPFERIREVTKKYLGRKATVGGVYVNVTMKAKSDEEMEALAHFWQIDCNYGLEPFLINLPFFEGAEHPTLFVKFITDQTDVLSDTTMWDSKRKLQVLGVLTYTIDDQGNFILTDAGDFIFSGEENDYLSTGNSINSYREIIWQ